MPSFRVRLTATDAAGVTLATAEGLQSGDPWSELLATPDLLTNPSGCTGPYFDFVELPLTNADGGAYLEKAVVEFRPSSDEASVAQIGAPVLANETGCA